MSELTPYMYIDNIHPNEEGAKQTANTIWAFMKNIPIKVVDTKREHSMENVECREQFEQAKLIMSDAKCGKCPHLYECRYMASAMAEVVDGDM